MNLFDLETNPELREQILNYFISSVMTDAERAKLLNLPKNCRIREGAKIISPENLRIGENVWIGENAILDASGGLEIGENTQIGLGVYIWTHDSYKSAIMGKNTKLDKKGIIREKTTIGRNCFIGGPSVIMPGVTIGDKCVISPMSVVYKDLSEKTIYKPYYELTNSIEKKNSLIDALNKKLQVLENLLVLQINFNLTADEILIQKQSHKQCIATVNNHTIIFIEITKTNFLSTNNKHGEIVLINNKALVATQDYFLSIGLIDDGSNMQNFKDYVSANHLWGKVFEDKILK